MRIILDILEKHAPVNPEMTVIGGLAQSNLFCQILADVFNRRVKKPPLVEEATSLGAAIAGGVATGLFKDLTVAKKLIKSKFTNEPSPENRKVYEKLYPVFKKSYEALSSVYEELVSVGEE